MTKYATAMLQTWDDSAVATTDWRVPKRVELPHTATTTPRSEEVAIWIRGPLPEWFERARDALNTLSALPPNWNSYTARQVNVNAVTDAVRLLVAIMDDSKPLPTFVPTSNGGVLLEWHTASADLEVAILPNRRGHVVFEKMNQDPVEFEGLPQEFAEPLKTFLKDI
jgi:hypothetical protein